MRAGRGWFLSELKLPHRRIQSEMPGLSPRLLPRLKGLTPSGRVELPTATYGFIFIAKSTIERMAMPVGPLASQGRPSSIQQVEAMSR